MKKIDDGGPAEKKTLRDYFAAKAMASYANVSILVTILYGLLKSIPGADVEAMKKVVDGITEEVAAKTGYGFADAMIVERKNKNR